MKKIVIGTMIAAAVTGCASNPDYIGTAYVTPMQFKDYDCDQIGGELERVSRRCTELHGSLKQTATADAAQMAVGMVLFWPALLFLEGGDGPQAAEYARLKGEWDTLEQLAIQNKCAMTMPPRPFKEPAATTVEAVNSTPDETEKW